MKTLRLYLFSMMILYVITQNLEAPHGQIKKDEKMKDKYQKFMQKHNKKYKDVTEVERRYQVYENNQKKLEDFKTKVNAEKFDKSVLEIDKLQLEETQFFDLTDEEYQNLYLTLKVTNDDLLKAQTPDLENFITRDTPPEDATSENLRFLATIPVSYDWRTKGAVGPVKNQGQCGACYTFAVNGNLEGQYYIKYKKLVNLSEQQILNCDNLDYGCNGGIMANTYRYIMGTTGVGLTSSLRYTAYKQMCIAVQPVVRVTSYKFAGTTNESTIAAFLINTGPLAAAVNANYFRYYTGGIMRLDAYNCPATVNHAITIVGYGNSNGVNYWIIKNSWGSTWGEQGYIRLAWGTCGINSYVLSGVIA